MPTPLTESPEYLTVTQFARRLAINRATVLNWIHGGKLAAVDIAQQMQSRRSMWRIPIAEYERLGRRAEANADGL